MSQLMREYVQENCDPADMFSDDEKTDECMHINTEYRQDVGMRSMFHQGDDYEEYYVCLDCGMVFPMYERATDEELPF